MNTTIMKSVLSGILLLSGWVFGSEKDTTNPRPAPTISEITVQPVADSEPASGPLQRGTPTMDCGATSSAGAVIAGGSVLVIGQPMGGTISGPGYTMDVGIITCLIPACVIRTYGDVHPPLVGNGVVDVDDIACTLDAFNNSVLCPEADLAPCGGNGTFDVDDIAAVLDAFAGVAGCPDPCL